jgi:dihydroneopterin aldolase
MVKEIVEGRSRNLLENVAEAIAGGVLDQFDVDAVRVGVKKPEVPMKGSILDYAGVEIYREREGLGT